MKKTHVLHEYAQVVTFFSRQSWFTVLLMSSWSCGKGVVDLERVGVQPQPQPRHRIIDEPICTCLSHTRKSAVCKNFAMLIDTSQIQMKWSKLASSLRWCFRIAHAWPVLTMHDRTVA